MRIAGPGGYNTSCNIGYDPWHIDDSLLREFQSEFGEKAMIPVRQGVITLSQPMKDLKADLQAKLIVYNDHPIDNGVSSILWSRQM